MLTILIPVYNFDIRKLVRQLHEQGNLLNIPFEIICSDDGSEEEYIKLNKEIEKLDQVSCELLKENLGRSKIRNHLASRANYEFLLFMDCDSLTTDDNYLKNYVNHLDKSKLLYGGRTYQDFPPEDSEYYLHWHYGKNREESSAEKRCKEPYKSFMTNNFLIPKAIFNQIKFDEQLTQYGHEDSLFGLELKNQNIEILHIDNPLEHIGIEKSEIFINKTEQALQNLYFLNQKHQLGTDIRILNFYLTIQKYHLSFIVSIIYWLIKKPLQINLRSQKVNLWYFDFYKLWYLQSWKKNITKKINPK
jgi:glycosyltransferase involved in cell wall biosynthesis